MIADERAMDSIIILFCLIRRMMSMREDIRDNKDNKD